MNLALLDVLHPCVQQQYSHIGTSQFESGPQQIQGTYMAPGTQRAVNRHKDDGLARYPSPMAHPDSNHEGGGIRIQWPESTPLSTTKLKKKKREKREARDLSTRQGLAIAHDRNMGGYRRLLARQIAISNL